MPNQSSVRECNCLSLYDWEYGTGSGLADITRSFFEELAAIPDSCRIQCDGKESKVVDFHTALSAIRRPQRNLAVECYASKNSRSDLVRWDACVVLDFGKLRTASFAANVDLDAKAGLNHNNLFEIMSVLCAPYGIGFRRRLSLGPIFYAVGIVKGLGYSELEMIEAEKIGKWLRERIGDRRHLLGYLRDVYERNVLSSAHIAQTVRGLAFENWVEAQLYRGDISQIGQNYLWIVAPENISIVRDELNSVGMILCY